MWGAHFGPPQLSPLFLPLPFPYFRQKSVPGYPFIVFGDYKEHFATRAENIIEAGKKKFEKFFRGLGVSEQPGKEPHRNISTLELEKKIS